MLVGLAAESDPSTASLTDNVISSDPSKPVSTLQVPSRLGVMIWDYERWGSLNPHEAVEVMDACRKCMGLSNDPKTQVPSQASSSSQFNSFFFPDSKDAGEFHSPPPPLTATASGRMPADSAECTRCGQNRGPYASYLRHYYAHYYASYYGTYYSEYYSRAANMTEAVLRDVDAAMASQQTTLGTAAAASYQTTFSRKP